MHPPSRKPCVVCGKTLSVHEGVRGDACSDANCQLVSLRRRLQTSAEQRRRAREQAARWQQQLLAARSNDAVDAAPVVLLPANQRPLGNPPEKRRRRFRDYFTQSLSKAAARRASQAARDAIGSGEEGENQFPVVDDLATLTLFGNACGTCRGYCCEQGGEHAFQRPEVIRNYMDRYPHLRPRDVLQAYLSRLPRISYRESCVYHGQDGCNLPQQMRSRTCNEYLCEGLREIHAVARESGSPRVFAAAVSDQAPVRVALLEVGAPVETGFENEVTQSHNAP